MAANTVWFLLVNDIKQNEIGNNRLIPSVISFKLKVDLSYFAMSIEAANDS